MANLTPYRRNGNSDFEPFHITRSFLNDPFYYDFGFSPYTTWGSFRADVKDMGNEYLVEAELPGARDRINIDVDEGVLTISVDEAGEQNASNDRYLFRERHSGRISRSFSLSNVNESAIAADYRDGILFVHLPKEDQSKKAPRKIDIQ